MHASFRHLFSVISLVSLIFIYIMPSAVLADAATHELTLTAYNISKADCGQGSCVTACSVRGTLKNVGYSNSVPISVRFWYESKATDDGEAVISLGFNELRMGSSDRTQDEAYGLACKKIVINRIEVVCPERIEEKCPGFYYIQFPEFSELGIKKQKIEGK